MNDLPIHDDNERFETISPDPAEPPRRPRGPAFWPWAIGVLALVVILVLAVLWWRGREAPAPQPVAAAEPASREPAPAPAEAAEIELPELEASDAFVRELVAAISSHPQLAAWLANDALIRRFTVSVVNVAEGISPDKHLPFLAPGREFRAQLQGDDWVIDPRSYARYDTIGAAMASLDAEGAAELYYGVEPLVEEAYRDLGYPSGDFRETLRRALVELLSVPRPSGPIELEQDVSSYEFADPALEGLSDAQKQLLRMGPANVERVQLKLREIGLALGFTAAELR